jgi:hypothetical protein
MSDWNEETLRKAASWKAWKEGSALLRDGCVLDAAATITGWRGTVGAGKRPMRVSVIAKSHNDLEARCPCPENQSSGAICCHAVATGLAVLRQQAGAASEPTKHPESAAATAAQPPHAWDLRLSPRWQDALARGLLAITAVKSARQETATADARLHDFLNRHGFGNHPEAHLQLRGPQCASLIQAIADHPHIRTHDNGHHVEISAGHRLAVAQATIHDDQILLIPQPETTWLTIDGLPLHLEQHLIQLAGPEKPPARLLEIIKLLGNGKSAAVPQREFLDHLASWQEWLEFPDQGWLADIHFIPVEPSILLHLDGSMKKLSARLLAAYPGEEPLPPSHGQLLSLPRLTHGICHVRNLSAEQAASDSLARAGFSPTHPDQGTWQLTGESNILRFLTTCLPNLQSNWSIQPSHSLQQLQNHILTVSPKIKVLSSGDDWLQFDLQYQSPDGQILPTAEIRRLIQSGNPHRKLPGNRHLCIHNHSANIIESLISECAIRQENGHYSASKCAAEIVMNFHNNSYKSLNTSVLNKLDDFQIPATVHASLRPYQLLGCAWLADRIQRYGGALLADDMGLGKTIQTIVLIEHIKTLTRTPDEPVLVVATRSLLGNWRAEFERFAPSRKLRILHGSTREAEQQAAGPGEVWITSYGTLARDLAWHLRQSYALVVVDEASLMRNPDTEHARAVAKLNAQHRIALTGTPIENGVRDLWSIFRFIQPGWLGNRDEFRERYELALAQANPPEHLLRLLRLKTSP